MQQKFCPILSLSTIKRPEESKVLALHTGASAPKSEGFDVVPCQGPQCAFFCMVRDESKPGQVSGQCAATLLPMAVGMMNATIHEVLNAPKA